MAKRKSAGGRRTARFDALPSGEDMPAPLALALAISAVERAKCDGISHEECAQELAYASDKLAAVAAYVERLAATVDAIARALSREEDDQSA